MSSKTHRMGERKYSVVWASAAHGIEAIPIEIEAFIAPGLPRNTVVGLPRGAVRECLDRIRAALRSSDIEVPRGAITINLAPADVTKDGTAFDLPVALALIAADKQVTWKMDPSEMVVVGELALDGAVRSVRGVLSLALWARTHRKRAIIIPEANLEEVSLVEGIEVFPVTSLNDAIDVLNGRRTPRELNDRASRTPRTVKSGKERDFSDVVGQQQAKRALEIAAAGGHNVLMVGAPGSGKTMLAQRLPSIMPSMSVEEEIETIRIHSSRGILLESLSGDRPFRAPHHSISEAGLVGGGRPVGPGEISLAHNGILFLDEFPEFNRNSIESLRQPLEQGSLIISRVGASYRFPTRFMLVAAMNPCPCGYFGTNRACVCTPGERIRYRNRISGPLLDRIDIHIQVAAVDVGVLKSNGCAENSESVRTRVSRARKVQAERFGPYSGINCNADVPASRVALHCLLTSSARRLLLRSVKKYQLSVRAFHRISRVARTIADLAGQESVTDGAIAEAVQYNSVVMQQ